MPTAEAAQAHVLAHQPGDTEATTKSETSIRPLIDGLTIVLAVVSIVFALVQKMESGRLMSTTERLMSEASTGFAGEFPKSIPTIKDIVQGGCEQIRIMTDVPGYGQYSAPDDSFKYQSAIIEQAHSNVQANKLAHLCGGKHYNGADGAPTTVQMLLFSPDVQKALLREQFQREDFLRELNDPRNEPARAKFLTFFHKNPWLLDGQMTPEEFLTQVQAGSAYERFIDLMAQEFHVHEEELRRAGVQLRYTSQQFVMRLWIQDEDEAAFSFDHSAKTEIAFRTRDANLLQDFRLTFDEQWRNATDYAEYWKHHGSS